MNGSRMAPALLASLALGCPPQPTGEVADKVFTNGQIYTLNAAQKESPGTSLAPLCLFVGDARVTLSSDSPLHTGVLRWPLRTLPSGRALRIAS